MKIYKDHIYSTHFAAALFFMMTICAALNCSNPVDNGGGDNGGEWLPEYVCAPYDPTGDGLDRHSPALGLTNAVVIDFGALANLPELPSGITIARDGAHVTVNTGAETGVNVVLRGTAANGSVRIFGQNRFNLYLYSLDITNPHGPAINIQNNSRTDVYLVGHGCAAGGENSRNILADGAGYGTGHYDSDANDFIQTKATFFSEAALFFYDRGGSLEIYSRNNHALATDDYLVIESGNIIIHESANDGIHVNDRVEINGGTLQILAVGEAIQNERFGHDITVSGGEITLFTTGVNGHGITSDSGSVFINGGTLKVTTTGNGSKGLRSSRESVTISGGAIYILTAGNVDRAPGDTSTAAGIKSSGNTEIHGGTLNITGSGENSRGINSDSDVIITDGIVRINADGDGIQVEGFFRMSGGTVFARSLNTQDIDCNGKYEITGGNLDAGIDERKRR